MPDLKQTMRDLDNLFITQPHYRWLELPEDEQIYSERALKFVQDALSRQYKRPRTGRFSASSVGDCERRILFGFANAPALPIDPDSLEIMALGSWGHLRWQAEGLTTGWLEDAEVYVSDPDLRIGGSMDGVIVDGSIFELKTAHWAKFVKLKEPPEPVLMQVHAYMMMSGRDLARVIYEDRSTGAFREFPVRYNPRIERQLIGLLRDLNHFVDVDTLPAMLPECRLQKGEVYRRCQFREHCPKATGVKV